MLEPYDGKLSCTVLRGESGRKAGDLPGTFINMEFLVYPYYFVPSLKGLNPEEIFVVMPFESKYDNVYSELIEPAVDQTSKDIASPLKAYRTKGDPKTTSGWIEVLEHLYTAQIVLGVLTRKVNANVHYELGIAHSTQPIRRQVLIAEGNYKPQFDTKDLIFMRYTSSSPADSVGDLSNRIKIALDEWKVEQEKIVHHAIAKITPFEFEIIVIWGGHDHFAISTSGDGPNNYEKAIDALFRNDKRFMEGVFSRHCEAIGKLQNNGLLGLSTRATSGRVEFSYYWTDLGNLVLSHFELITDAERRKRYEKIPIHLRRIS